MLKYSLTENLLTERSDDYSAQAYAMGSLDKGAIIERILGMGTTVGKADVQAVLTNLEEVVVRALREGFTVNMPLFNTSFSISGVFESPMDSFDGNRHKLNINLTKGALLREEERNIKLEKTSAATPLPQVQEVKDSVSGTVNERLTPNGVAEVRGYNLKIDGDDRACGLWFVPENGREVQAVTLIENKPSRIIAMIPALPAGSYQVKVVTQFANGVKQLKTPKVVVYPKSLMVG